MNSFNLTGCGAVDADDSGFGLSHRLGGSKRTQLSVDKQSYPTGDRVAIYARLYSADFNPLKNATVEGGYTIKASSIPSCGPRPSISRCCYSSLRWSGICARRHS